VDPRVTVGGPIVSGKVQLLESIQYEYSQTRVYGLPPFESDTKLQSFETFTRADWLRTHTNRFTASVLASPRKTTYAGLNTFNPQSVTANNKSHNVLGSVSDQAIVGTGVIETRASVKEFDATIYPSQGAGPMVLAPNVNSGSYFNDQDRTSRRAEWLTTTRSLRSVRHISSRPAGASRTRRSAASTRADRFRSFARTARSASRSIFPAAVGSIGTRLRFEGSRRMRGRQGRASLYCTAPGTTTSRSPALQRGAARLHVARRHRDGRTIVRAGGGMFYNAVPLNAASFDQLQTRTVTIFAADGITPVTEARLVNAVASDLRAPRSVTWNLEIDREWLDKLFVRVGYQQRDNRDEEYVDADPKAIVLRSDGQSRYREAQVTARYTFHGDDRIVASYTRSSTIGNRTTSTRTSATSRIRSFGPTSVVRWHGTYPIGCSSGRASRCRMGSPCFRCSTREPAFRFRTSTPTAISWGREPGRTIPTFRVARCSGHEEVQGHRAQRDHRPQGVSTSRTTSTRATIRGTWRAATSRVQQQRRPDVPRQMDLRILRLSGVAIVVASLASSGRAASNAST